MANLIEIYKQTIKYENLKENDKVSIVKPLNNYGNKTLSIYKNVIWTVNKTYECHMGCKDCQSRNIYVAMISGTEFTCSCHFQFKLLDGRVIK